MKNEKKIQYVVWGVLGAVLLGCLVFVMRPAQDGKIIAKVQLNEQVVREIALDTAHDEVFSIEEETGIPITFEIKDHAIRFLHSDCPDKICINTGFLSRDMDISSCLPNRVVLAVAAK